MKNKKLKTLLTSALLVSGSVLFGMLSLNNLTESKASNISISGDNGVDVYVSGEGVTYNDSTKKYEVQDGTTVTVTVVNDQRMFTSMKIGETEYNSSVVETTASGNLEIEIETTYSTAAHQGKCFGRAWSLSSEADITKLVNILNGTDPQFSYFAGASTLEDIQYGYYYVTNSIFYDVSNSETNFYGIGTATNPFHGCIDFLNNYISISSTTNGNISKEYAGFFGVVENGSGIEINFGTILGENNVTTSQKECVLRNVSVKGNISFRDTTNSGSVSKLSVGGIAGKVSKDVILDNIDSSVSISVEASNTAVTAGAIFGTLETRIDTWEKVKASGAYTTVKAISNGSGKDVYVGSLAGEVNNVSVYGFNNEISNGIYIANSLNNASGNSIASSFVGVLNAGKNLVYENIKFIDYENIDVSSVIKNSSTGSIKNVYGALGFGLINGSNKVDINSIDFIYSSEKENLSNLYMSSIRCSTADVNSKGNAYAGGLIAYSNNSNVYWNNIENKTLYKTNVYIEAEVNGTGSAYAGGLFGYTPALVDNTVNKNIVLNAEDTTIEVYATQLTNCKESNDSTYNIGVASGYYAPLLDINNESLYLHNLNLTVNNGILSSTRQVGSKAEGNIYAGGLIGVVYCRTNNYNYYANQLVNLTINLNNSSVSGLGLSFVSDKVDMWKNNVDVGGMFGHLDQCGVMGSFDSTNLTANSSNSKLGASNLNVNILVGSNNEEYAVKGIQNAAAGDHDHQNQGHIGGAIGMLRGGYISNINVTGDSNSKVKPIITFNSTNSPNTAAAGGVIGENARDRSVLIEDASADNIHVICRAFSTKQTDDGQYDVYAGGIIGVLANAGSVVTYMVDSNVNNSTVECVGEEKMLSICGGIVGGAWWDGTAGIYNSIVTDSNVLANSVSFKAYAGGFAGVLQISTPTFDNIIIVNNYISATSNSAGAYSAGVVAWAKKNVKLSNVYLNSIILGEGGPGTGTSTANQTYSRFVYSEGGNSGLSNIFINPENLSLEEGTNSTTFVEFASSYSSEVDPLYISNTNNIYYSVGLKTGDSAYSLFNAYPLPANAILRFSGDVSYLKDSNGDVINADTAYTTNTVRVNSNQEGTVYVSLRVVYDGKEYELVNQPIYINKGDNKLPETIELKNYSSSSKTVITSDNDQVAGYKASNVTVSDGYVTDYYYAIVNVGQTQIGSNKEAAQSIQISYSDYENYNLYATTASFANELGEKDNNYLVPENADYETRIKSILANKKKVMDFTFFDSLIFGYEGSSVILTPRGDITETVFIIYEFGNGNNLSTVVIEFVPNSLESIEVLPESYTNELGIRVIGNEKVYTYAPLDTINFKVVENHRFTYEYSSKGYSFTGPVDAIDRDGISTSLSTSDVTVDSNGRTVIKNTNQIIGATFGVKATSATDSRVEDTIYIFVDNEVSFTYDSVGAYFESNRKVVDYTDFDFKVTPMAGYGLKPTKLNVILRTDSNSTTYDIKNLRYDLANSLLNQTVTANGINFNYSFNVIDGSYDITIPGSIITDEITSLLIEVEFGSTYNIVFDKGYEPPNGSGRYFIYQMTYGTVLNEDVYNEVLSHIGASQYGYEFQGYYLVQEGKTLNDYGYSFEEYCFRTNGAPTKTVTGPMQFYARFTYEVIAMLPDIFELNTNLFIDEVMPLESNDPNSELIRIIPVDVNNGFTFTLKHDGTWYGDIPFEVYIIKKESHINVGYQTINDETLTQTGVDKITDKVQTLAKNTYYIPPELINGYIVIRGFAEEMTFSCGESEVDTGIHDIYGDAIFTAMYSVTYNKEHAVDIKESVSYSNIEIVDGNEVVKGVGFGFKVKDSNGTYVPFYLPQNTSIRLYRFINHELYDVGVLVLKDGSKCEFFAHDFVDLRTGKQLVLPNVTGVFDQKYNLVITLPNYEGIKQDYKNVEICLLATFKEHYNFYDYVNETVAHVSEDDSKALAFDVFNVYKTLGFTVTEGTNTFTFTKGKELENLDDHRHENKYYVWKVAKTNPGFVEKINFGGLTPIVETNDAYYYLVTDGQTVTISQNDYNKLKGYTVAILEVENLQDPASGQLIYSKAIS